MAPALLLDIVTTIVQRLAPRRVLVFGSHARGDAGPDSDIDLFIELDTNLRPPDRAAAVAALFPMHPWSLDVVVYTPDEVLRLRGVHGTLLSTIEAEGKVVYERAA